MPDRPALVALDDVFKSYGGEDVLRGATATTFGPVVVIAGPSGAGKTTLVDLLLGRTLPDRGSARVFGRTPATVGRTMRVGHVPQATGVPGQRTAAEFCAFAARLSGISADEARERAHAALDWVGLGPERREQLVALSRGGRQRARVAAALVNDPELLVLDEPTAGLDTHGRLEVFALLADVVARTDAALIVATSRVGDAMALGAADTIVLEGGVVTSCGPLSEPNGTPELNGAERPSA